MSAVDSVAAPGAGVSRFSGGLLASELRLMITRRRNIVGLVVLCLIPVVIGIVMKATQPTGGDGPPFFSVLLGNGLFLVLATLTIEMTVFLPMALCILAGDSIAGEANIGTLRYLLTVPVGRTRLLLVKFAALTVGAAVGVALVALTAAITGLLLFGAGDMVTLSGTTIGFAESAGRIGLICLYVMAMLTAVAAIGLFASTLTEQPIGAAIGTFMWILLDQVLGSLSVLDWLHPFLLTHFWSDWIGLLRVPMELSGVLGGLVSAAVYIAVFGTAAWARMTTRDISS